tara:strand:+ start:1677 stop:1826 length:150 start_codon:yes stop_codon:yes gene_type:complete
MTHDVAALFLSLLFASAALALAIAVSSFASLAAFLRLYLPPSPLPSPMM